MPDESVTWEVLKEDIIMRTVFTQDVDQHIKLLQNYRTKDITVTAFERTYDHVIDSISHIKGLQATFRQKAAVNHLLNDPDFVEDSEQLVAWYLEQYNKLDKLKPKGYKSEGSSGASEGVQSNVIHDAMQTLNLTLQQGADIRTTSASITRPSFKGGVQSHTYYESYKKNFKTWTFGVTNKIKLFQFLRDTLSGSALKQINEFDITEENYIKAWKRLDDKYLKPEECRGSIIDKIFSYQFNNSLDKMEESFNNYCLIIDKLKTAHNIDLLESGRGFDTILAHLTFKRLPQSLKNKLLDLCSTHYPTFEELVKFIPTACDRILKSDSEGAVGSCNVTSKSFSQNHNYNGKGQKDKNSNVYCVLCKKDHYTSNCTVFSTVHDRIICLRNQKRCTFCTKLGHSGKDKCVNLFCSYCKKNGHSAVLCVEKVKSLDCNSGKTREEIADFDKVKKKSAAVTATTTSESILLNSVNKNTALPFALTQVVVKNSLADCKVLFDQGSQISLVSKKFVNTHKLKSNGAKEIVISGVTGKGVSKMHKIYPISIKTNEGLVKITAIAFDKLPTIQMPGYSKVINKLKTKCDNLASYPSSPDMVNIELLIGCDYYFEIVENKCYKVFDTLSLIPTKVGSIACGPYNSCEDQINSNFSSNFVYSSIENSCESFTRSLLDLKSSDEINKDLVLSKIFTMENLATNQEMQNIEYELAYKTFEKEIYFDKKTKQYCVPLLFKGGFPPSDLPTNYNLTVKRNNSLKFQLDKPENYQTRQDLADLCNKERELSFIEPVHVSPSNLKKIIETGHFLPAVLVRRESKTTPLRRCFDCSAKIKNGNSLNNLLFTGPNLVPKIFDIIIRSRYTRYFLLCDISKAFLRLQLIEKYRDFVKIILREDWTDPKSKDLIFRFKTVLFGSSSSPFLLQATISHHLNKINMSHLLENLFVDDISFFSNSIDEILRSQNLAVESFNQISMPLSKYVSNSEQVTKDLVTRGLIEKPQTECKLLGTNIDLCNDSFIIKLPEFNITSPTLTSVLSDHASVWDVIGLIEPVRVASKVFINSLHKAKLGWKDKLNDKQKEDWKQIVNLYKINANSCFSRLVSVTPEGKHTLHMFTDASDIGYAGAAYVSTVGVSPTSKLLCAKSKLKGANVKSTIPKLELSGIIFGLEILDKILNISNKTFPFESIHLWSDAKVPLSWICSKTEHSLQYISNRTKKAKALISKYNIKLHYIESENNPADLLTKGFDKIYYELPIWMEGPNCIRQDVFPIFKEVEFEAEVEKPQQDIYVNAVVTENHVLARIKNVSSFKSLLKITHMVLNAPKIILSHRLKDKNLTLAAGVALKEGPKLKLPEVAAGDVNCLFLIWIKYFQSIYFKNYLDYFHRKRTEFGHGCQCCNPSAGAQQDVHILKGSVKFGNLHILIDSNDILRVRTRSSSTFKFCYRYPILLPKNAHFAKLYAQEMHVMNGHVGANQTVCAIRDKVWIINARSLVNKLIADCATCKLHTPKIYETPHFPSLPETRMSFGKPFEHLAIDLTGHYVLFNKGVEYKRYVLIIACLSSRAVHALVCRDNSAGSFVHCLKRHITRYGTPSSIITDNAKNFKSMNHILETHSNNVIVKQLLMIKSIKWTFTPNYSPWSGAIFEAMVKIIKKILAKTFNSRKMSIDDMITLVSHAEFVANQRPISYVTQNDQLMTLTPNLLIFGRQLHQENWLDTQAHSDPDYTLVSQKDLGNAFKKLRAAMGQIESDFYSLYLDLLRERDAKQLESKQNKKRNIVHKVPEKGDVILLIDENNKPHKVSRIVEVGKGSEIRQVKVILNKTTSWRPVSKVSFFEIGSPQTLPDKFVFKESPDKHLVFPRDQRNKLDRLAKQNVKYTE